MSAALVNTQSSPIAAPNSFSAAEKSAPLTPGGSAISILLTLSFVLPDYSALGRAAPEQYPSELPLGARAPPGAPGGQALTLTTIPKGLMITGHIIAGGSSNG